MLNHKYISARRLAAYLLLWNGPEVAARPNPLQQRDAASEATASETVEPVTSITSVDGNLITAIYTPTSISITGLVPPITSATTVTTTDSAGETIAVAVAAGAGVVAAGALAGWLFKPVAGAPPAPTTPPPYSTEAQDEEPPATDPPDDPVTTTEAAACPFPTKGSSIAFSPAGEQPAWTAEIPSQTDSSYTAKCTPSGDNGQLFRGIDPGFIKELSIVFCKNDLSKDFTQSVGKDDLPDDSSWKRDDGPEENVKFTFDFKNQADGCADYCEKAYSSLVSRCQYNSHYLYGGGSLEQGCGTYALEVDAEPITKLTCTGDNGNALRNYVYRDAALEAIDNFCTAQDGRVVKQNDDSTFIKETTFSISYASPCGGSGEYKVEKDLCVKYLRRAVDDCDTNTIVYKHGGGLEDEDNCGLFELHPKGYDLVSCYPDNAEQGYITAGDHASVTSDMARDAINAFCDRSGDGQQYTLDPAVKPDTGSFIQDTCKEKGMASCGYQYLNDGTRVEDGKSGDIFIRLEAFHFNPNNALECGPDQVYEIHGDRCKKMLNKLIGDGSVSTCVGDDKSKLDLGTFVESGDKGCVTWNMWAINI